MGGGCFREEGIEIRKDEIMDSLIFNVWLWFFFVFVSSNIYFPIQYFPLWDFVLYTAYNMASFFFFAQILLNLLADKIKILKYELPVYFAFLIYKCNFLLCYLQLKRGFEKNK